MSTLYSNKKLTIVSGFFSKSAIKIEWSQITPSAIKCFVNKSAFRP